MVADSTEADKALEPPPAKRLKNDAPEKQGKVAPPAFGDDYVRADGGWFAHKGGEWLYNDEEKTFFHLPSGALHMATDAGLVSLTADADAEGATEEAPPPERRRGVVKWFNAKKGFGFIAPKSSGEEDEPDLFVHRNQLLEAQGDPFFNLESGAKVSFALGETDNGRKCAVQVQVEDDGDDDAEQAGGADDDDMDDGQASDASSGSSVEIDLEEELLSGTYTVKGAVKDHCEDFAVQKVKIPISALGETATCLFYGVFDGHGGFTCAEYAAAHLAKNVLSRLRDRAKNVSDEVALKTALIGGFKQTEHNFCHHAKYTSDGSGSTACTLTIFGPDENMRLRLFLANVGDSRAVLGRVDGKAVRLTEDHKPDLPSEKKRIEAQGGSVADVNGCWRCMLPAKKRLTTGIVGLAVSRSLGDKEFKNPDIVSAEPDVTVHEVDWDGDEFVIIASDGIWDVVTDKMAVRCVQDALRKGQSEDQASEALVRRAVDRGSKDDCTVVVIHFGWVKKKRAGSGDTKPAGEDPAQDEENEQEDDEDDEEDADLEGGLTIAPHDLPVAAAASVEKSEEKSAEELDLFEELEVSGGSASASAAAPQEPDDSDDDDEYDLVGGTLPVPSTDVASSSDTVAKQEGKSEATGLGLFDDLVPTREELAMPQGPSLPPAETSSGLQRTAPAADDGLDMFSM